MPITEEAQMRLAGIPNLTVSTCTPLALHTRFGIGGPADLFADTASPDAFAVAVQEARAAGVPVMVIGGGTNLIVSDEGFRGLVLRYTAARISANGALLTAEAGAVLDDLVDFANASGLRGLETLAGIPGWVGAAVYGNAGAYGHSLHEFVRTVRFFDGARVRSFDNAQCEFRYRESIFKRNKEWVILSVDLALTTDSAAALQKISADIREIRNRKFPPTMKCAGSIFKNFLLRDLPETVAAQVPDAVVREGKVPAAWFLEQVGSKGAHSGDIRVADYHANLIYNEGAGTAHDLRALISDLKQRVRERFAIEVEEEVQYVG
jgi:UDP-N-acetylmuramate dehydrogenase